MQTYFSVRWGFTNALLAVAIIASAQAVVQVSHQCRDLYGRLQVLESERWSMQENQGRLLLEQSTWAAPHRVEEVALQRLGMKVPGEDDLRVVLP